MCLLFIRIFLMLLLWCGFIWNMVRVSLLLLRCVMVLRLCLRMFEFFVGSGFWIIRFCMMLLLVVFCVICWVRFSSENCGIGFGIVWVVLLEYDSWRELWMSVLLVVCGMCLCNWC